MRHIVIIGNGISGITAARHIRKLSNNKITVISGETEYFFSRTALMYVYMGHMRWKDLKPYEDWFWDKNRISLKKAWISEVNSTNKTLLTSTGEQINYDELVLATGAATNFLNWKGAHLNGVQGLVSKQDLDLLEKNTKNIQKAVIVGGGLIGVELAEMLRSRNIEVSILVREKAFANSFLPLQNAKFITRHIISHGVKVLANTELDEIIPNKKKRVKAIKTTQGREIECQFVGIATGIKPNIAFLKNTEIETDIGILVNKKLETNIPNIYAVGDCAQQREPIKNRPAVESVWYTGRIMGKTVAQSICGEPTQYKPGNWFNSAKFFDVEYQTYGHVRPEQKNGETNFYWEAPNGKKAIHINFETVTGRFLGINTFGIRMRHEVLDNWLTEGKSMEFVLENLEQANFDPEFYKTYETEFRKSFNQSKMFENGNHLHI